MNIKLTGYPDGVNTGTALEHYPGTNVKQTLNSTDQKFRNFISSNSVMANEVGINKYFSLRKADGTSSDPVPDPDILLPIDLLPPMPWIISVVIPIIVWRRIQRCSDI